MNKINALLLSLLTIGCVDQKERFLVDDPDLDAVVETSNQDAGVQDIRIIEEDSDVQARDVGISLEDDIIITYRAIFNLSGEQGPITIIGLEGGEEGRLNFVSDYYYPSISKDSKFIVAAASVNGGSYNPILNLEDFHGLGIFNLQGEMVGTTRRRNLLSNNPVFSADSSRIAYVEKSEGNDSIRIARVGDDGEVIENRFIKDFEGEGFFLNYDLMWAGDSKLAFYKFRGENNARKLNFIDLNNNQVRELSISENERGFNRTSGAYFFDEGRYFAAVMDAYVNGRISEKAIGVVSSDGREMNVIFDLQTNNHATYLAICPDEQTIVFVYDSPAGSGDYRIDRINRDGSDHREVARIEVSSDQFGISLDHFSCRENNFR